MSGDGAVFLGVSLLPGYTSVFQTRLPIRQDSTLAFCNPLCLGAATSRRPQIIYFMWLQMSNKP